MKNVTNLSIAIFMRTLDSQVLNENGLYIEGHSSYLWFERDRRFILYGYSIDTGKCYQIIMRFDNPTWDFDTLQINEIDKKKNIKKRALSISYPDQTYFQEIMGLNKLYRFVKAAVDALTGGQESSKLCDYFAAKKNMQLLEELRKQSCAICKS